MKRGFLTVILFLAFTGVSEGQPKPIPEQIRDALTSYQAGDRTTAVAKLRDAHRQDASNPDVRLLLGLLLYEENPANSEVGELLGSVADRFAGNAELQVKLLDAWLSSGKKDKLQTQLVRLESHTARDTQLAFQVIYLLLRHGATAEAQAQVDKLAGRLVSSSENPVLAELDFVRGLVASAEGKKPDALKLFQSADRRDFPKRDSIQMLMLADALFSLGEIKFASQAYADYLGRVPGNLDARMHLGMTLYSSGRLEQALKEFETVRAANGAYPEVNYRIALIHFDMNRPEDAEKSVLEELRHNPKCGGCLSKLAHIQYQQGQTELAEKTLAEARALDPNLADLHLVAGLIHNRKGEYAAAIEDLESALQTLPEHPTVHLQLSIAYGRVGNAEKAGQFRGSYNRILQAQKDAIAAGVK